MAAHHHPLVGVVEKLRRADVHIKALYASTEAYVDRAPYGLSQHSDLGDGRPGFRFHITEEPPLHLASLVGDALHNLRCALDYLACELTIVHGGTVTNKTSFPISLTEDDFINQCAGIPKFNHAGIRAMKVASAFQPYRLQPDKTRTHPLWLIAKLSNVDKHNMLPLAAIGGHVTATFLHPDGRTLVTKFDEGLIENGAVVASFAPDFFHQEIKSHLRMSLYVTFRDEPARGHEIVNVVQSAREFIGEFILPAFEPFFEQLPDDLRLSEHGLPAEIREKARENSSIRLQDAPPC